MTNIIIYIKAANMTLVPEVIIIMLTCIVCIAFLVWYRRPKGQKNKLEMPLKMPTMHKLPLGCPPPPENVWAYPGSAGQEMARIDQIAHMLRSWKPEINENIGEAKKSDK